MTQPANASPGKSGGYERAARRLGELVEALRDVHVLLVGDLMLDRYLWGDVSRISPEAPVPVLKVTREELRLGGAGCVASNLSTLGAKVHFVGAVGDDHPGRLIGELMDALPASVERAGLLTDPNVHTTQKTRLLARTQQLMRVDRDGERLPPALLERLEQAALAALDDVSAVLISDYARGVLGSGMCSRLAAAARARGIPCIVDPHPNTPFEHFRGVTALTPNRAETARAVGILPEDDASIHAAASALIERFDLEWVALTLDKDGIHLLKKGEAQGQRFPAKSRAVYDVTGAGDMVLTVLGLAVAAGAPLPDAVRLANIAAGLEVERIGVVALRPEELIAELGLHAPPALRKKIVSLEQALPPVLAARQEGARIVFTNGCFDLLHAGHVHFLQGCREKGDFLVVGLNTDESIRGLKGPDRPVLNLDQRSTVLAGMEAVDLVIPFADPTPVKLIQTVQPDILCKGEDYVDKEVVGREIVEGDGGRVELVKLLPGVSTTRVIERIGQQGINE
ncbi:MAG: bifunctional heptose 7-phosphate kinase/heptose 1-phosphate adenyltransferase [Planctomycetes bacterium]|nr:bifunctional heptose 7-phosphate kinase/heptose 1-phosphate adenyltransferase [Planctomycetota bacterium]